MGLKRTLLDWDPTRPIPSNFHSAPAPQESEQTLRYLFSSSHSYFRNGKAYLSGEDGKSRLAGFFQPSLRIEREKSAFFGFWESVDDVEPNSKIFSEVESWARGWGAKWIYGPINFSTLGRYRLQLSHFGEGERFSQEPVNPAYYPTLLGKLGYQLGQEYSTYRSNDPAELKTFFGQLQGTAFARKHFIFRSLDQAYFEEKTEPLRRAMNDIFNDNFAFMPIDSETFKISFGNGFLNQVCSRTSFVVEDDKGQIAALCICLFSKEPVPTLFIKTIGIVKNFRGKGVSSLTLIDRVLEQAPPVQRVELCLMRKGNFPNLLLKELSLEEKSYGLFKKRL